MSEYPLPLATVDVVLLTVKAGRLHVLLHRRLEEPYEGAMALPGGYIHLDKDDDTLAAARRVLRTKIGLEAAFLEQLFTFSGKFRDPRKWSISVSYFAVVPEAQLGSLDDKDIRLVSVDEPFVVPFDHKEIIAKAVDRLRGKSTYSTLPMFLLPAAFTMAQLHGIYQSVMGAEISIVTFRRKMEAQGAIEEIPGAMSSGGAHRPAQLYRRSQAVLQEFRQTL
jgi:8-oxo-dGTP diphosphatase